MSNYKAKRNRVEYSNDALRALAYVVAQELQKTIERKEHLADEETGRIQKK